MRQGRDGDCWLMAALCTLGNKEDLIDKVCVARDEKVGVYGFVFHRGMGSIELKLAGNQTVMLILV